MPSRGQNQPLPPLYTPGASAPGAGWVCSKVAGTCLSGQDPARKANSKGGESEAQPPTPHPSTCLQPPEELTNMKGGFPGGKCPLPCHDEGWLVWA